MGSAVRNLALVHLEHRPEEAVRILERCSAAEVAALLEQAAPAVAATALARLSPRFAADCLAGMSRENYADVFAELSPPAAAALLRHAAKTVQETVIGGLSERVAASVRDALAYPRDTAGALASTDVLTLFGDVSAGRAVEMLRVHADSVPDRIPVLDRSRRVLGALRTAALCWAPPDAAVGSLTLDTLDVAPAKAPITALAGNRRRDGAPVPVVDRSGGFIGVLEPDSLRRAAEEHQGRPATELVAAFSELCWFGLTGVVAGLTGPRSSPERDWEPDRRLG